MRHFSLYFGMAAMLVASCSAKENDIWTPQQDDIMFYASFEKSSDADTKVYANKDLLLRWTADDRVTIFNKNTYNQEYRFTGETGDNAGGFKKVDSDEFVTGNAISHVVSVYPYHEGTKITESETITVNLPAEQHYAENTFGLGANMMVSVSSDNFLQYKNVGGYLMLKLYGEGVSVSSITLKGNNGEKLSGKASVSMPVNGIPTVEMSNDAREEITLVCDTPIKIGSTAETATTFWFVLPPTVFSKGVTIAAKDNKNDVFEKATSTSFEISRSKLVRMSPLKTDIPGSTSDPNDFSSQYLTFEILSDGSISWVSHYNAYTIPKTIEYSQNNGPWNEITSTMEGVSINVNKGDIIRFRGDNESYGVLKVINSQNRPWYNYFRSTCQFKAYGNIMSLINSTEFKDLTTLTESCAFFSLFNGCVNLIDASHLVLPAITLTERCYWNMFLGCSNLVSAPELPATSLADYCYYGLFSGCTSLQTSPNLPATSLADHCYERMFMNCSNLVTVSDLPATSLRDYCYSVMFYGCTGLLNTPTLPATKLADYCYNSMFQNCTNLKTASNLPATTLTAYCYFQMYTGCSSLASAPELLAEVLVDHCYYNMFFGCTNLQYIKCLATDISASNCTTNWTYNVSSTGVFVRDVSMNSWLSGSNGIPKGWTTETNTAEKYEAVDLGLSVKWADMNLGATKPEEYGDYYAWGETATKTDYTWESYLLSEGRYNSLQKYNFKDSYGVVDGKNTLDDEDDAAYNGLGANWRMPTIDEFRELQEECDWTWTNNNGIKGYLVKSKTTDKSIFLPAAGYKENDSDPTLGYFANYWTASLHNVDPSCAWCLVFSSGSIASNSCNRRYYGYSIRPVFAQ